MRLCYNHKKPSYHTIFIGLIVGFVAVLCTGNCLILHKASHRWLQQRLVLLSKLQHDGYIDSPYKPLLLIKSIHGFIKKIGKRIGHYYLKHPKPHTFGTEEV